MGMLSYQAREVPHAGQWDRLGKKMESPGRGRRHMQTFRKLPMQAPKTAAIPIQSQSAGFTGIPRPLGRRRTDAAMLEAIPRGIRPVAGEFPPDRSAAQNP